MRKNVKAIEETLAEADSEGGFKHLMAKRARDMYDHTFEFRDGPLPDRDYFSYYLKISFDMRYWVTERSWDAGGTYEFPDGHVEIWCGPDHDGRGYRVYTYSGMDKTHDWMLD